MNSNSHCFFTMNGGAVLANTQAIMRASREKVPFTLIRWLDARPYPEYIRGWTLHLL